MRVTVSHTTPMETIPQYRVVRRRVTLASGQAAEYEIRQKIYKPVRFYLDAEAVACGRTLWEIGFALKELQQSFGLSRKTASQFGHQQWAQFQYPIARREALVEPVFLTPEESAEYAARYAAVLEECEDSQKRLFHDAECPRPNCRAIAGPALHVDERN